MVQELEATVGLDVEADDLLKQLQAVFQEGADLIGNSITSPSPASSGAPMPEASSGGKGMSLLGATLKGMLSMAGKIFAGVSIIMAIIKVFQPVLNMIDSGMKMIAELLRPLSDMLLMLLAPLLSLIKPIVVTMKTLMAPFKQAAQQLAISGGKALRAGDHEAGMTMLMASAATMLGPFVTILVGEALKLASTLILTNFQTMINGILLMLSPVIEFFGGNVENVKSQVDDIFGSAKSSINDVLHNLELDVLTAMAKEVNKEIETLKEDYPDYTGNLQQMNTDFGSISTSASVASTDLDTLADSMDISTPTTSFVSNMSKIAKAVKSAADKINSAKIKKVSGDDDDPVKAALSIAGFKYQPSFIGSARKG